ncbi:hypothetical protein BM525_20865 (plasmid) [Alteromonas mediterranea]|uniref:Uncharacterized protein n=1 Tax=Alteromonas mediterranea TaxID=314275 RepID=A0AAC9JHP0_9ALTE|nr:hypothetical protein BM524_20640 [Alteromonas mediterranea]APE00178.1 hypothetical protein BM525_20865 [Alteromonas mediterranea]
MSIAKHHFCGKLFWWATRNYYLFLEIQMTALPANKVDKTFISSNAGPIIGQAKIVVRKQQMLQRFN